MIIIEYYEQIYAYEFNNLYEMNKFLESHELQKLYQKELYNLSIKGNAFLLGNFSTKKNLKEFPSWHSG